MFNFRAQINAAFLIVAFAAIGTMACSPVRSDLGESDNSKQGEFGLMSPARYASAVTPENPQVSLNCRFLYGAYGLEQFPGQNAQAADHNARFTPDVEFAGGLEGVAFVQYRFAMQYFEGDGDFTLAWEGDPPQVSSVFIGLGNFDKDSWDWFMPDEDWQFVLDDFTPYVDPYPSLLMTVVVLEGSPCELADVTIGEQLLADNVNVSQLFAPPVDSEIAFMDADFASRNPVEQDYVVVGEIDDDNRKVSLISHTVDGNTHYGFVSEPIPLPTELTPVILVGHAGTGGAVYSFNSCWLSPLLSAEMASSFIFVTPTFRSEVAMAGELGIFTSEGEASLYDRDVDDALALLDCVLNNFPMADPDRVCATGYSRGALVMQRVALRSNRIDRLLIFAGMSDEWVPGFQVYLYNTMLALTEEDVPDDSYHYALWARKFGVFDVWQTRQALLTNSTIYWAPDYPPTQIHCGGEDGFVTNCRHLAEVLEALPGHFVEYFEYPGFGHLNVAGAPGVAMRTSEFLAPMLE